MGNEGIPKAMSIETEPFQSVTSQHGARQAAEVIAPDQVETQFLRINNESHVWVFPLLPAHNLDFSAIRGLHLTAGIYRFGYPRPVPELHEQNHTIAPFYL